jgi:DNA-directed RNA polymerase specialized sigma24 family protein
MRAKAGRKQQVQRRLTSDQVVQLIGEYEAGNSMLMLAKSWRLHRTTVAEHLRRAGIPVRQRGIPAEMVAEVIRLYEEGWSCQRLGDRYGCDDETVRQSLRRAGITMRKSWERRFTPKNPEFE